MTTSGNTFYDLLREQFERKSNSDIFALQKETLGDMFFSASAKLGQSCYLEAQNEFWNIIEFIQQKGEVECGVDHEAMYCFECYYCYSYIMSNSSSESCEELQDLPPFFTKTAESLVKKYPNRHFPKYLQMQCNLRRKRWLLCMYYCELLRCGTQDSSADTRYKDSQFYNERLVPEMNWAICLRNLNKIEECCYFGYLEEMFEKIDNRFIEEFIRIKRGINFEDIEDDFILSLAMRYQNDAPDFQPLGREVKMEKIDKTDILNMLLSKALVSQKTAQTQTTILSVDSRDVQTDTVKRRNIGLQKNDEEVQNRVVEEKNVIKNLEKQLMEKEIEIQHLRKQQDQLEREKKQTTAKNLILQKLLLYEASEKANLYATVYNDIKDHCKFMLKNIADIGPTLTPNTGLDRTEYRLHFDYWMKKSSAMSQHIETLNNLYSQMKVDMIYHDNFVATKWPVIPKIKDDMGFIFRDLKQLIKKHMEVKEKQNSLCSNQIQSQIPENNQIHPPAGLGRNPSAERTVKPAWNGKSWAELSSSSTTSASPLESNENRTLKGTKKVYSNVQNEQRKQTAEQQTSFEFIWKTFCNVEDEVVTKALLAVLDKNNGSLANIPKDFIVQQVKEELSHLKKREAQWHSWKRESNSDDEDRDNDCPICFEALLPKSKCMLPCSHKYHKNCIKKWLRNNTVCPICRVHVNFNSDFPTLDSTVKLK